MDQSYIEKGYCCKLSEYPSLNDGLYIRPNKIYEIGNSPNAAIQIGDILLCHLVCDKEGNVVLQPSKECKDHVKINGIDIKTKTLLKHHDIIKINNAQFQFHIFFKNGYVKINCKKLHVYLLKKYPLFTKELKELQEKTTSIRIYRKGLRELFQIIEKKQKEKIETYRIMLRDVISILLDENPQQRLNDVFELIEQTKQQQSNCIMIDSLSSSIHQSSMKVSTDINIHEQINEKRNIIVNNEKEKSLSLATTLTCVINCDEHSHNDEQKEICKRQKLDNDEYQSKRSYPK